MKWDFGVIEEKDGSVWHSFYCVNESGRPVVITQVTAGCRCVSADYPRTEIKPGASFELKAKLDPAGLAGKVVRELTVHAAGERIPLTLEADIVPDESVDRFRYRLSSALRAEARQVRFGYVPRGGSKTMLLQVKNVSSSPVGLREALSAADAALVVECPETLAPGEDAEVALTFTARPDAGYGRREMPLLELNAEAIVTDDFSRGGKSPAMRLYPSEIRTRRGRGSIRLYNDGVADLVVRDVESVCETDLRPGDKVAPGKSRKIKVRTKSPGSIFVVTNDPVRPYREIRIQ